jgi:hypothetical protein
MRLKVSAETVSRRPCDINETSGTVPTVPSQVGRVPRSRNSVPTSRKPYVVLFEPPRGGWGPPAPRLAEAAVRGQTRDGGPG